jgi:hypothetical protein
MHRTISINPQFFNMSKKKKPKIIPSQVNINSSNIRQLLLDKLKEHKKTRKIESKITPLQNKSFDEQVKEKDVDIQPNLEDMDIVQKEVEVKTALEAEVKESKTQTPYGNLKNGTKPTFKQLYKEKTDTLNTSNISNNITNVTSNTNTSNTIHTKHPEKIEEKEVKKIFKLGKKGKTISVLIKNNKTRKLIEHSKIERKKKNLATIKNYLKDKNLIKFGTTAPSKLLREIYETSELCGGILNENKDVLIHNFDK